MTLFTARHLIEIRRRHDYRQDRLSWLPEALYDDRTPRWEKKDD